MPDNEEHNHFLRSVGALYLLFLIHLAEILWFTGGFYFANEVFHLGSFTAKFGGRLKLLYSHQPYEDIYGS